MTFRALGANHPQKDHTTGCSQSRSAPAKAAFVPILVVWFGIGAGPAILPAFLILLSPILVNMATGLVTLEPGAGSRAAGAGCHMRGHSGQRGQAALHTLFFGSIKVANTVAFVRITVIEMTAAREGVGYLLIPAGSSVQMALGIYERFSHIKKNIAAWAHSASQGQYARV